MLEKLLDIAQVQFGYYDTPSEHGEVYYLQAKHFDDSGEFNRFDDSFIPLDEKSQKHILQPGDILLAGKGYRLFAWQYEGQPSPAVASTLFFVINVKNENQVLPTYLTTFLNLPKTQAYLKQLGAGTSIPSIRKNELGDLSVPVPSLPMQQNVVHVQVLHQRQIKLLTSLISEKQLLVENLINQLIHAPSEETT
ncbi:restriction endonuclease subunit S [Fibrella aquatica]|uniref:restriction endonuclease subunit S n=1 Tax=Fibrella aquatica TaxID=3242487 RepID=UPI00352188AF